MTQTAGGGRERVFPVSQEGTLLEFLLESLPKSSRNNVKSMLSHREVLVDGRTVTQFDHPLTPGSTVQILRSASRTGNARNTPRIIYEDGSFLVIDKPEGLLAVSAGTARDTAWDLLEGYMRKNSRGGHVYVTHRLDRDTSGILLFSKSEKLAEALQADWNSLVTLRRYDAVAEGAFTEHAGTVRSFLKETASRLVYSSHREGDGLLAVTRYAVTDERGKWSRVSIELETGRKNQIRVHMKDLGHSVAGDSKYGAATDPLKRLALHADALELTNPLTGEKLRVECRAPECFDRLFVRR